MKNGFTFPTNTLPTDKMTELYALSILDEFSTGCIPHMYSSFDKACDAAEQMIDNWYETEFVKLTETERAQKKKELEESEYGTTEYYSEVICGERLWMSILKVKID